MSVDNMKNSLPYPSISTADDVKYAVFGSHPEYGSGIISWHGNEIHANYNCKFIITTGGTARVDKVNNIDTYLEKISESVLTMLGAS